MHGVVNAKRTLTAAMRRYGEAQDLAQHLGQDLAQDLALRRDQTGGAPAMLEGLEGLEHLSPLQAAQEVAVALDLESRLVNMRPGAAPLQD
ncbi:MAG: hypothetical protein LDL27_00015 [Desulfovibrio sp.]|nr:hypothetical protein [Desulfovibrio sp.]